MNIIFDLDGTLIDSSERMYRLFSSLVPESTLTKEEYWRLKRNKINHQTLLETYFPDRDFLKFEKIWLSFIEKEEYLLMDQLYPDTIETLEYLNQRHTLYLVTARQSRQRLFMELQHLEILSYFSDVLSTGGGEKDELLREYIQQNPFFHKPLDVLVGDMGKDINTGHILGYQTVAITHGFMNKENLLEYGPRYIIDELSELKKIIGR